MIMYAECMRCPAIAAVWSRETRPLCDECRKREQARKSEQAPAPVESMNTAGDDVTVGPPPSEPAPPLPVARAGSGIIDEGPIPPWRRLP